VTVPANTRADHHVRGRLRQAAQAGSHAFATAYLQNRQNSAQADLTEQISALDAKVKGYAGTLSQLSNKLASSAPTTRTGPS